MTGFIKRVQSRARNYLGKELSPNEMATEFAKWDMDTRVTSLEELEVDDDLTLAERLSYERTLRGTHERLRKAGR